MPTFPDTTPILKSNPPQIFPITNQSNPEIKSIAKLPHHKPKQPNFADFATVKLHSSSIVFVTATATVLHTRFGNRPIPNGVEHEGPVLSKLGSSSKTSGHI
ncbi:hypothetical protein Q3G72_012720 [Acer saccharum]|nr:hypothetical protein Q3G72_012720 [Acer saccharum]